MESQDELDQQIQTSFQKATEQRKRLKIQAARFALAAIVLSALATFMAGVPSLMGQPIIGDWRLTCAVAAVITLAATIVTSVQNQVTKPDFLTKASESVVRLRILLMELQSNDCDYDKVRKAYQGVLLDFPDLDI